MLRVGCASFCQTLGSQQSRSAHAVALEHLSSQAMSAPTVRAVRRTLNQHLENAWDRHPTLLKIGVCNCGNDVYTRKALLHEELSLVCFDSDDEKGEDGHLWSEVQNGLDRPFTGLKNRAKTTRADLHGALKTFRKRKQVTADDDDDSAVSVGGAAAFQNIGIQRPSASGQQPSQFEGPAPGTKRKRRLKSMTCIHRLC